MLRHLRRIAVGIALLVSVATVAQAQGHPPYRPHIGAHLSYNFDAEEFGIGPQFYIPVARHFEFYPSFDYYFVDGPASLWQLNVDMKYKSREQHTWFYLGGGLAIARASAGQFSDTDIGVNLLGGVETVVMNTIHPYLEGRLTLRDNTAFQLAAGLKITIY
jgi:hypothetical protein